MTIVAACSRDLATKAPAPPEGAAPADAAAPADTLVLRASNGVELWYTLAWEAHDSAGAPCIERALEIRNGERRIPVPLLYTRDVPRPVNESTVTARIWNHCAPGDAYRVSLRNGQPMRARQ